MPRQAADLAELAGELGQLRAELRQLGERVDRLEQASAGTATAATLGGERPALAEQPGATLPVAESIALRPPAPAPPTPLAALPAELTHVGRLLLVLAGAFLLRAATEGGQLPRALGVSLGLCYGLAWLPAAQRAGKRGERVNAAFHAFATLVIVYPLVWEATVRFRVLGVAGSLVVLTGITGVLLATAWRQRTPAIGWLLAAATAVTAAALAAGTRQPAPFAALLVALAGTGLVLGERPGWQPFAWATAGIADLAAVVLTLSALLPRQPQPPLAVLPVQLLLALLYLGGGAVLARQRALGWLLLLQIAAAVGLGWGGALLTARAAGGPFALAVGCFGLLVAGGSEALALRRLRPTAIKVRLVFLFAATALALGGVALALPPPLPAAVWAVFAVVAAVYGARAPAGEVELQAAVLATAATLGSGALGAASAALLRPAAPALLWQAAAALALLAAAACLAAAARAAEPRDPLHSVAAALLLALVTWVAAGAAAAASAPLLAGDAGLRAALGTALLAAGAALLVLLGRGHRLAAAAWLVYPLLIAMAIKLLLVDLRHGRPLTLFLSLAALGAALLVAARPARRTGVAAS